MRRLTLYTRVGCPLCDAMAQAVRAHMAAMPTEALVLLEVDVDADAALQRVYGWDVPLLFDGANEIGRHVFDAAAFEHWLTGS